MTLTDDRPAQRRVTPTARIVLPADAPRDQWLDLRRRGIGSSDIPNILNVGHTSPLHVYYDKTGRLPGDEDAGEPALWGSLLEDTIAREWARRNKSAIRRVGLVAHVDEPWRMCTLDRRVTVCPLPERGTEKCALEVKNRNAFTAGRWKRGLPDDVLTQVLWQIAVTGYDHLHVAVLIGSCDFRQFTVRPTDHPQLIADISTAASRLWHEHVLVGVAPHPTGDEPADAMIELWDALHPTRDGLVSVDRTPEAWGDLGDYVQASADKGAADKRLKSAKAKLYFHLGDRQMALLGGHELFSLGYVTKPQVNVARLREKYPDAFEDCKTSDGYDQIRIPANVRKEHTECPL
jgi:putative phage-type endonuclease